MKLAVIPARGGSKRIPRKNILPFCGKPMIAWSIEMAIASECFDRIIVSTDSSEIAEIARFYGAEVPFVRPPSLSDDHADTISVVSHAVAWQGSVGMMPVEVCCIYATAPFLRAKDIRDGLSVLQDTSADYAISVARYAYPVQRALRINSGRRIEMCMGEHLNTRTQDLEQFFHDAGQFYWGRARAWLDQTPIFSGNAAPILLPDEIVQDIDTIEDWRVAELKFSFYNRIM